MDNWLLVIVGFIFLLSMIAGGVKGFFKISISLISSILTVVLVIYLAPYVEDAVVKYTPLDEMVEEKCVDIFMPEMTGAMLEVVDLTGTPLEGFSIEELKSMGNVDWEALNMTARDVLSLVGDISKDQQIVQIENSVLPEFLQEQLLANNNNIIYEELGVQYFPEYVAAYMARLVIKIVAFLLTFLFAIIIVKALAVAIDILGELPGVGFLNHAGGALVGILMGLLVVWFVFLVITLLYSTELGQACFKMIEDSWILSALYDSNILLDKLIQF